jgi:hypothetical protein
VVSFPLTFPPITYTRFSSLPFVLHALQSHPSRLHYSNYTWRRVQIMELFIMQFPQTLWNEWTSIFHGVAVRAPERVPHGALNLQFYFLKLLNIICIVNQAPRSVCPHSLPSPIWVCIGLLRTRLFSDHPRRCVYICWKFIILSNWCLGIAVSAEPLPSSGYCIVAYFTAVV